MSTGSTPPKAPAKSPAEVRIVDVSPAAVVKCVVIASLAAALVWLPIWILIAESR